MKQKPTLWIDQHGYRIHATSRKELREKVGNGGCNVSKMYISEEGKTYHIGYVIGEHWFRGYIPMKKEVGI